MNMRYDETKNDLRQVMLDLLVDGRLLYLCQVYRTMGRRRRVLLMRLARALAA